MSGEEAVVENVETNAEVVENVEVTEVVETSEDSSEVSIESVNEIPDEELDAFLAKSIEADAEALMSEQPPSEASEQAEPVGEAEVQEAESEEEAEASDSEESEETTVNYEEVYKQLFDTPFKANGREIQIDSVDEAIQLMQKGLGYNKDMAELKPYKKAMNVLKKRDALDPEKLDFLLDVAEGKPEAIAKLLQDKDLNPYDIDIEAGNSYESTYEDTESVDTLNEIFNSIESGDAKLRTLQLFSGNTAWDTESRARIYQEPESVRLLHEQVADGTFDTIMSVVDKKRALGQLTTTNDLDAYNMVGNELANQGKLGVPNTPTESSTQTRPISKNKNQVAQKKKAAGAPRNAPSNVPNTETFNPATATDEEVEKFLQDHLRNSAG
jgi:hypothetical protein